MASIDEEEEEEELNDAGGRETPPEAIGGRFKDDHRQRGQGMGIKCVRCRHLCRRVEEGGASTAWRWRREEGDVIQRGCGVPAARCGVCE